MTKESRLFSAPSESYLPSYESSVPSIDDCSYTFKDETNVFHRDRNISAEHIGK